MTTVDRVRSLMHERLAALEVDADTYAEYVATVVCDESMPPDERRTQLLDMFSSTLEDPSVVTLSLSDAIYEALQLFESLRLEDATVASAAPALAEQTPAEPMPASTLGRLLERNSADGTLRSPGLDSATKRAILQQLAFDGSCSEGSDEDGGAKATGKPRSERRRRRGGDSGPAVRTLDDALGALDALSRGVVSTTGLGRRAKRAVERAAEASDATPLHARAAVNASERTAILVGNEPAALLKGAHAGVVARHLGTAMGAPRADPRRGFDHDAEVADVVGGTRGIGRGKLAASAVAGPSTGERGARGAASGDGNSGTDGDAVSNAEPPSPTPAPAASRVVLNYDPMAGARPDNRGFQRRAEEAQREAMRLQHEAEEAQRKHAAEAARAAREVARQSQLLAAAAGAPTSGRGGKR